MNWEAIGAVAELLGAIGVIVSLMYLASQVRRNTHKTRCYCDSVSHHSSGRTAAGVACAVLPSACAA